MTGPTEDPVASQRQLKRSFMTLIRRVVSDRDGRLRAARKAARDGQPSAAVFVATDEAGIAAARAALLAEASAELEQLRPLLTETHTMLQSTTPWSSELTEARVRHVTAQVEALLPVLMDLEAFIVRYAAAGVQVGERWVAVDVPEVREVRRVLFGDLQALVRGQLQASTKLSSPDCYREALAGAPGLEGQVMLKIIIDDQANLDASVLASTLDHPKVETCVAAIASTHDIRAHFRFDGFETEGQFLRFLALVGTRRGTAAARYAVPLSPG